MGWTKHINAEGKDTELYNGLTAFMKVFIIYLALKMTGRIARLTDFFPHIYAFLTRCHTLKTVQLLKMHHGANYRLPHLKICNFALTQKTPGFHLLCRW